MKGYAAKHVFEFDKHHLDRCTGAILMLPAGKSGHLELGYIIGQGKPGYILLDGEPTRFDQMYQFAKDVFYNKEELGEALVKEHETTQVYTLKKGVSKHGSDGEVSNTKVF
jgi:nucleoside 2-deoxyribosyltransferase